jgi:hypothetical protein
MVQPPIPTSIPGTLQPAFEPDSAIATGPDASTPPRDARNRPRRPGTVALIVLAMIIAILALWLLGDHRTQPGPIEPATPPAEPRT